VDDHAARLLRTGSPATAARRPQNEVFGYLADGAHNAEWRAGVLEIEGTSASDGEGATYRQVLSASHLPR
jgi:hypothetical protein